MNRQVYYFMYGFLSLIFVGAVAFKVFQPIQVLPRIRLAPGFTLYDGQGNPVTSEDMRGRIALYGFWAARCRGCEQVLPTMTYVAKHLPEQPEWQAGDLDIAFVIIDVDPERDGPVLAEYTQRLRQETGQPWFFVTHPDVRYLKTVVGGGFEVFFAKQGDVVEVDPKYIIVDGWGIIRGEYAYQTIEPNHRRLLRHLNVLAQEIHNSKGAARVAYEAAHLFLCYAK